MKPQDIDHIYSLGRPSLSPDGSAILVTRRSPRVDHNDHVSRIWMIPTADGEPPRRFTHGDRDAEPAYSPDGRWVAFVRPDGRGRPQLHVMRARGGDAWQLTHHPMGVAAPVWSPDADRIAYLALLPEPGRYGTDPAVGADQEPPRLVTRPFYQADGLGYTVDRRRKLHVLDLPAEGRPADPWVVLDDEHDEEAPVWNPDGTLLAFAARRRAGAERESGVDIHVCAPDGSGLRVLTDGSVSGGRPAFTPDGTAVLFVGVSLREDRVRWREHNFGVWRALVEVREKAPERVTAKGSVDLMPPITANALGVCFPGDRLVFSSAHRGVARLVSYTAEGDQLSLLDDRYTVGGYCAGIAGGKPALAVSVSTTTSPGEVVLHVDGKTRALTNFSGLLSESLAIREPEEIIATASDGYPVHGWVVRPGGPGPHPVLLHIHGGPHWHHTSAVFDEAQVYAEAGYAVALCNPRGSLGYGPEHSEAIDDKLGTVDADDLLAFVEQVAALPGMDTGRVGIMGGSYGGTMTSLLIGRTDRFAAAISERATNDQVLFVGTSDVGWLADPRPHGESLDRLVEQSPMSYVDRITTPTLIVHSEKDLRCSFAQAQVFYAALLARNVPTALLIFPGENHNLTRSGQPRHRVERFRHVLDWWARYLPTERNPLLEGNPYAGFPAGESIVDRKSVEAEEVVR
ncbi:S9 family peptidase [Amycolatopsis saalfeldensis]|uniref:Dipeptidyl aminopeptidase/acylaminoacyl peptidase n=1 Tax=Amycolatopsis saalfeldensis TaxID=394193 RepID=A0A1H8XZ60_9PSEU|nr:S9 family peptidase [Amycolatopsis saalfeldensis]SEP44588.1 Dipeptidyl aminopeptidase/acylaminoacyl peptidase [Amycolatopsis saalfeldensis]